MEEPMKRTNRFLGVIAAVVIGLLVSQVQTRAAVTVYADETGSNAVLTGVATVAESGVPSPQTNLTTKSRSGSGNSMVRIDETGVHIGGPSPVDIQVPTIKSRHPMTERAIDVVGLVGVVCGCIVPIVIVAIVFYFRHRRLKVHHETMRAMIEKGMPIPPEMIAGSRGDLLMGNSDTRPGRSDARSGLILVAVGAGLLMFAGKVGWILVFIGAARLVLWLMDSRN
jgi:hypothetical protein